MSNNLYEHEENQYLMAKACKTSEEKSALFNAYITISKDIEESKGCSSKYGLVDLSEAILSAGRYEAISRLISIPEKTIIVDCGCATGLQQVFFRDCHKYIGIDVAPKDNFFKICENAEYISGDIGDILYSFELDKDYDYFGVSVLCGSVWRHVGVTIKQIFNKCVII